MQIIPVIDIRNGAVMRARAGERDSYTPIVSALALTSAPVDVVAGFLALHSFERIYIADLDAIEERGDNRHEIEALIERFPAVRFMVDAGAMSFDWRGVARVECVIGSESLRDSESLRARKDDADVVLSLDFRDDVFLGPDALNECADLWPSQVIVMTLARIGVGAGPDLARVSQIIERAGVRRVFAAGGVSDARDLEQLEGLGAAGALVATALHDGTLTRDDLDRFSRAQKKGSPKAPLQGEPPTLSWRRKDVSR